MNKIDNYKLKETLGSGFSAKVKLATDSQNRECALKIFDLSRMKENKLFLLRKEVKLLKS